MTTVRTAARFKKERPPCYGTPSVIDPVCGHCKAAPACFKKYSEPLTVRVLAKPKLPEERVKEARDEEGSVFGAAGLDFALYARLATAVLSLGFKFRRPVSSAYAGHFVYKKKRVINIRRLDARDIVLDFRYIDVNVAAQNGAKLVECEDRKTAWQLRLDPKTQSKRMQRAVSGIIVGSLLAGVLGKSHRRKRH